MFKTEFLLHGYGLEVRFVVEGKSQQRAIARESKLFANVAAVRFHRAVADE